MLRESLAKISHKNKIILLLFLGSILLAFFTLSQRETKQYYQKKIAELQHQNQNSQFYQQASGKRYQEFLIALKEEQKNFTTELNLEVIEKNLSIFTQNANFQVLEIENSFEDYLDFSLGQKSLTVLTSYKDLNEFLVNLEKESMWISFLKIKPNSIYSRNPKLNVEIRINFLFQNL